MNRIKKQLSRKFGPDPKKIREHDCNIVAIVVVFPLQILLEFCHSCHIRACLQINFAARKPRRFPGKEQVPKSPEVWP